MKPLISIIVPIYNVEKYLSRCINSVLSQTFPDFELLLIDDGSTDKSGYICDGYAQKDSRIKVFHIENGGVSAARNYGLDNARGEWITFVDADDWIDKDMYYKLYNIWKIKSISLLIIFIIFLKVLKPSDSNGRDKSGLLKYQNLPSESQESGLVIYR